MPGPVELGRSPDPRGAPAPHWAARQVYPSAPWRPNRRALKPKMATFTRFVRCPRRAAPTAHPWREGTSCFRRTRPCGFDRREDGAGNQRGRFDRPQPPETVWLIAPVKLDRPEDSTQSVGRSLSIALGENHRWKRGPLDSRPLTCGRWDLCSPSGRAWTIRPRERTSCHGLPRPYASAARPLPPGRRMTHVEPSPA